ncbi:MAG: Holliday junction branch migration protein RuvA [Flavobacteriaceae bacterium]|jgi:Holliday junction DNA helicase RuvA|nr:Holliday junction branch migration protein RuvA [Flavobacteriaceae bacterium]MDG1291633.1 Holliday junction branch migration protein RuvA [Flavobacteriaceae bacterium]MDG1965759.1 Holliday junction branch migration protein RuvA [Flavobacteriaceae bacterium]
MITQIKGKLVEKNPTQVVVDCNGIGYEINISLHTFSSLSSDENIQLFTHLQVREDAHILYGFFTILERAVFRLLISVSGIGTSTARTMLSSLTPSEIQQAIGTEDVATIQGVKGIGLKTAQRVIIELKDKIRTLQGSEEIPVHKSNTIKEETLSALEVLGYSRKASEKVVDNLIQGNPDGSVEDLIKGALNKL